MNRALEWRLARLKQGSARDLEDMTDAARARWSDQAALFLGEGGSGAGGPIAMLRGLPSFGRQDAVGQRPLADLGEGR